MLPVSEDALQPLLKKQAKPETVNRADTAKSDHPLPLPEATAVSTGAVPRLLSQPASARAVTVSQPSTAANLPLPISPSSERLASATGPSTYPYDESFPERVTVSRPPPTNPSAVMEMERPSSRMTNGASANYDDFHTGRRINGGGEMYQRSAVP